MVPYNVVHLQYSCVLRHVPRLRAVSVDPSNNTTGCIMLRVEGYLELHEDYQVCCYSSDNLNERYEMLRTRMRICILKAYTRTIQAQSQNSFWTCTNSLLLSWATWCAQLSRRNTWECAEALTCLANFLIAVHARHWNTFPGKRDVPVTSTISSTNTIT